MIRPLLPAFLILAMVAAPPPAPLYAAEPVDADLIVESRKGGKNFRLYRETAGTWGDSDAPPVSCKSAAPDLTPQGQLGSRAFIKPVAAAAATSGVLAAARFGFETTVPVRRHVYITWPKSANLTPLIAAVSHAKGAVTPIEIAQNGFGLLTMPGNSDRWIDLGAYDFDVSDGSDQYVELRVPRNVQAVRTDNSPRAYADAVRFAEAPLAQGSAAMVAAAAAPDVVLGRAAAPESRLVPLKWLDSIDRALPVARSEQRRILLFFHTSESARSKKLEAEAFSEPALAAVLAKHYVLVKVDMSANSALAAKFGVFKAGALVVFDSQGNVVTRIPDPMPARDLIERLRPN